MRKLLLLATALVLTMACGPGEPRNPTDGDPASLSADHPLEVSPIVLDFPRIRFGSAEERSYTLRNRSDSALRIERIGPVGCDCAGLRLRVADGAEGAIRTIPVERSGRTELVLAPGQTAELILRIDTARYREPISRRHGGFAISFAGHRALLLEFSADVWTPYWSEPWAIELGEVGVRQQATGVVGVEPHDEKHFELLVPTEIDGWKLHLIDLSNESENRYRIEVQAPEELPRGPFRQAFVIPSSLPDAPPIRFVAQGNAVEDLRAAPARLILRMGQERFASAVTSLLSLDAAARFQVRELAVEGLAPELVQLTAHPIEEDRIYRITMRYEGPPPEAAHQGVVRVWTTDEEVPMVEIPFTLVP